MNTTTEFIIFVLSKLLTEFEYSNQTWSVLLSSWHLSLFHYKNENVLSTLQTHQLNHPLTTSLSLAFSVFNNAFSLLTSLYPNPKTFSLFSHLSTILTPFSLLLLLDSHHRRRLKIQSLDVAQLYDYESKLTTDYRDSNKLKIAIIERSLSVTQTVNGSHNFTMKGYSLAKGMGVGKLISSDNFKVGGYQGAPMSAPSSSWPSLTKALSPSTRSIAISSLSQEWPLHPQVQGQHVVGACLLLLPLFFFFFFNFSF